MLSEIKYSPTLVYRSFERNNPEALFKALFEQSVQGDLLLGYFSTTAFLTLRVPFAKFIAGDGVLRIVANDVISVNDKALFEVEDMSKEHFDLRSVKKMVLYLSEYDSVFLRCISFLIQENRLQIKFVRPKKGKGIAHYKSALFIDESNESVLVKGSCNFTSNGFKENLEESEVTRSWDSDFSNSRVEEFKDYFNSIWDETNENVRTVGLDEFEGTIRTVTGHINRDVIIREVEDLYGINEEDVYDLPLFPFKSGPRDYQIQAYQNWLNNKRKGVLAMATGTGKTLTSLNIVLREYEKNGFYRVIILVPTRSLVSQWKDEVHRFNFQNVFTHGNLKKDERGYFSNLITQDIFSKQSYVYIMTYASMVNLDFNKHFGRLLNSAMFIADEAHNVGAKSIKKKWLQVVKPEASLIALSATPERQFEDNTAFFESCFSDSYPYTFSYSMSKAIENGILCKYEYYPISVELTTEEFRDYQDLSEKIARIMSITDDDVENSGLDMLLIQRRRIVNNAKNKALTFKNLIEQEFHSRGNLDYSLVYSPEGFDDDLGFIEDDEEMSRRIHEYTKIISDTDETVTIRQITGNSKDSNDSALDSFESGKCDVLISMKCLDEGIDVPRAENGYFLSSSGNPRQFIQRRGRLLRVHPDKSFARIVDLVVVPPTGIMVSSTVRKIVKDELKRVREFGYIAMNSSDVLSYIDDLNCKYDT